MPWLVFQAACVLLLANVARPGELSVHTDFPGGSAEVLTIDQETRTVRLLPTTHPDRGWVCWWYFRLEGVTPGETITLDVGEAPWGTPDQAAFSLDGRQWVQTAPGNRDGKRIIYRQQVDGPTARFAWGPPFVLADAQQLVRSAQEKFDGAEPFILCMTRGNHPTPALRITDRNVEDASKRLIWIQARQHAWESGASWVASGLIHWLVSQDPEAVELRRRAIVTVVPIMDVDNVERGAGGKNEVPQDHNRDWTDQPHWRGVDAAQQAILKQNASGRFDLFIDLHNPSAGDKQPYFFVPPDELLTGIGKRNLALFVSAVAEEMTGPLTYVGKAVASGSAYDPKAWRSISKNWVASRTSAHVVAVTLETAWNTPASTSKGYEQVGRELGRAVARYLPQAERPEPGAVVTGWKLSRTMPAPEAHQAAAADESFVYAISSTSIAKYDRRTGARISESQGDAKHLNSGCFWNGKLLCAHSNYPELPERSEILALDPVSMHLGTFREFGNYGGSLTWVVRRNDHWWCNFARYGDDNAGTFLVQFDDSWNEVRRWTYPAELISRLGRYSLSGGVWLGDRLLVTGHDDPVAFELRVPLAGDQLVFVGAHPVPFTGQGIAVDPLTQGLVGIHRKERQVLFAEPVPPEELSSSRRGADSK